MLPRTTIAIPLHRADHWRPVVRRNIDRLAGHARIVVSDATEHDTALADLRDEFSGTSGVSFLGARPLDRGWVAHCNDLLSRAGSEFFAWLPQDDEIDADWVTGAERVLDERPGAILASGSIVEIEQETAAATRTARTIELPDEFTGDDLQERLRAGLRAALEGEAAHLGLVFRAVFRREQAVPLPANPVSGEWVDIFWALRMLSRGAFERNPGAEYRKRWYSSSEHAQWRNLRFERGLREEYLPDCLQDVAPGAALRLMGEAWGMEIDSAKIRLEEAVAAERDRTHARTRAEFERSRSWAVTKPLRWAGTWRPAAKNQA